MIRVLHVLCDLSGGGAERLVLELCRRASPDIAPRVATVQAGGVLGEAFAAAGVEVRCARRARRAPGFAAEARLVRWCREADIVHTHLFAGDTWGRTAAWLAGTPVVSTEHNIDRDEGAARQALKALTSRACAEVYAVSPAVAQHWRTRGVQDIGVVPNGVDLARYEVRRTPVPGAVLAVGRLMPQKGFDVLLEATATLPCTLQIAGEGPERAALESQLAPHQHLLGRREDIPALLAEAAVVAVPSRWEGFGLVALEAMAAGVPLVTSRVDGLAELVGDAALTVSASDADALRGALHRVLTDPQLAARLAAAGRRRARRFSIEATVRDYETRYRELTAG